VRCRASNWLHGTASIAQSALLGNNHGTAYQLEKCICHRKPSFEDESLLKLSKIQDLLISKGVGAQQRTF
jgi:hypothetical protein